MRISDAPGKASGADLRRCGRRGARRRRGAARWPARPAPVAAGILVTSAATAASAAAAGTPGGRTTCHSLASCYSPGQIRVTYGIQPLTDRGIDGHGVTVVLPALAEQKLGARFTGLA